MALSQSDLSSLLEAVRAGDGTGVLRDAMAVVLQGLIELDASQAIGAARYERTAARLTHRNGSRPRRLATPVGEVELRIPKLRSGSFFPALLAPRRRIDRALWAVVMEAYVQGVSTRRVDELVHALGLETGISKSEVSRICSDLDASVRAFRERRLDHVAFPYVFLDATYVKAHDGATVVAKAIVIATGVAADGHREILGLAVGDSEAAAFWTSFLRDLRARGLGGVRLVTSDAHTGLTAAIDAVLLGAAWQRCRIHFLRNVLARVPKGSAELVAALIRTIWSGPDAATVRAQLDAVAGQLAPRFPTAARMLMEAKTSLTAFADFPRAHWAKIWSTNPLERLNKEVKRRTDVVGIFPNEAAILRLAGAVLREIHDEWAVAERRYLAEASMAHLDPPRDDAVPKEVANPTSLLLAS